MKRGLLKSYLDTNSIKSLSKDFISAKNRRPSRIEERIRLRRLRANPHLIVESPEQITEASENITAESRVIKNSCDSSSPRTESCTTSTTSCSSSSNENMPKIRGSKQRVDLLELGASSRTPLVNIRLKKSRGKSKNPGLERKLLLFHQGKLKAKTRPRSAPCTPLFQLKYSKQNWRCDNFVDCKTVEKDCIDQPKVLDDDTVDCKPVGNPALIAVMTESLDKMRAELNANKNSCAVDEEIDGNSVSRKSSILNANSARNNLPNSVADSEGVLSEKQESQSCLEIPGINSENRNSEIEHEIHSDSNNYGCTVIEESTVTSQSHYNNCNCTVSNPASGPGSSCTNDNLQSPKKSPGNKYHNNRWENSSEKRPSSKPCGAQDTLHFKDDRGADVSVHKAVACTYKSKDCQFHRSHNYCMRRNFNHQAIVNENPKSWDKSEKDFCACSVRAGDKSRSYSLTTDSISESCGTHCVRNYQLKIPQQQCANNNLAVSKQKSVKLPNSGMTRSCDCHAKKRSCRKICGSQRSKSSPRRVTFRLPSLIPEEGIIQNFKEDDKETNFGWICNRKFSNIEPNRKSQNTEPQDENNEFEKNHEEIFASCCNSSHAHCRSCCMGHQQRRSRSPKVHFCEELLNKQREIVGDLCESGAGHREIESKNKLLVEGAQPVKNSDSKTSIGSEKDAWAEDNENILDNFENVSFPKETRQAMNVLLQSRETRLANPSHRSNSGKQRWQRNPEIKVLNKPDLGIFDSEGQKAMHVATYAQALAVFQRKSDPLADGSSFQKKRNIVRNESAGGN
ncbi:uncharacterized protein LOC125500285 [Athalia rosae]|uniref:uncharacterized protein LOC125500285 n=1 Tax=Athalia rosae TaxID=37344 RepID=UPI0020343B6B|nr:uncharacterized protein LOC125500285 [Athalia rosae]